MYEGSFYLPVRTAGEWMGKTVSWDGATQTVSLSGTAETVFHTTAPTASSFSYTYGESVLVTPRKDMRILLDGAPQTFRTQAGAQIYPLLYRGTTYLPLRSISELIGMQPAWRNATAQDAPLISLYTPMTEEQSAACLRYLSEVNEQAETYMNAAAGLMAAQNDKAALRRQLDEMEAVLDAVSRMETPDVPYLAHSGETITAAVKSDLALLRDAKAKLETQSSAELFQIENGQATGVLMKAATGSETETAAHALLADYQREGLNS